jgi:hypothetical protein
MVDFASLLGRRLRNTIRHSSRNGSCGATELSEGKERHRGWGLRHRSRFGLARHTTPSWIIYTKKRGSDAGFGQGDPNAALLVGLGPQEECQTQNLMLRAERQPRCPLAVGGPGSRSSRWRVGEQKGCVFGPRVPWQKWGFHLRSEPAPASSRWVEPIQWSREPAS